MNVLFLFDSNVSALLYTPIAGTCLAVRTLSDQMSFLADFDCENLEDVVLVRGESFRYCPTPGFRVCSRFSGAKRTFLDLPRMKALGGRGLVGFTLAWYEPGPGLD